MCAHTCVCVYVCMCVHTLRHARQQHYYSAVCSDVRSVHSTSNYT